MERVAFLVEDTGERIPCLLNPETLVVRRSAGVRRASSVGGRATGTELGDDPLIVTGGGRTELELDLLFDTSLLDGHGRARAGWPVPGRPAAPGAATDVRDLTRPLWRLAENAPAAPAAFGARRSCGSCGARRGTCSASSPPWPSASSSSAPTATRTGRGCASACVRVSDPAPPAEVAARRRPPAIAAAAGQPPAGVARRRAGAASYEVVGDERPDVSRAPSVRGRPWLWRLHRRRQPGRRPAVRPARHGPARSRRSHRSPTPPGR